MNICQGKNRFFTLVFSSVTQLQLNQECTSSEVVSNPVEQCNDELKFESIFRFKLPQ